MSKQNKFCHPSCKFFRCGQRAIINRGGKIYCRWVDDECSGPTCNYAICVTRRLLSNGICGLTVKRKTTEIKGPEEEERIRIKLKGKMIQRLKDREL